MMDILCQKVQERLQLELSPKKKSMVSDRWLLRLLAQNSFWIRAGHIIVRNGVLRRQDGVRSPRAMTFDAVRPVPEVFYYRDLFVWLPDLMFATTLSTRTLLTCPSCSSSYDNKVHGYLKARRCYDPLPHVLTLPGPLHLVSTVPRLTSARLCTIHRVFSFPEDYFVMARRHLCKACYAARLLERAEILRERRKRGENDTTIFRAQYKTPQYTWASYNKKVLDELPAGRGACFPARLGKRWLTYARFLGERGSASHACADHSCPPPRSGFDILLLDMLRPLLDAGVSLAQFSEFLLEIKSKMFFRKLTAYLEECIFKQDHGMLKGVDVRLFSAFADPGGYAARSPGAVLLGAAYDKYFEELELYFDLEMKKRGGEEYHVDVSYKVSRTTVGSLTLPLPHRGPPQHASVPARRQIPKHLARWNGVQLFKGLLTAYNEHKDIVQQFFLVTDSREQIDGQARKLRAARLAYGQSPIKYVYTDKPCQECAFWESVFPEVRQERLRLNNVSCAERSADEFAETMPPFDIDMSTVSTFNAPNPCNAAVQAMRDIVEALPKELKCVGLDAEWTVLQNRRGEVIRPLPLDVVSCSYVYEQHYKRTINAEGAQGPLDADHEFRTIILHLSGEALNAPSYLAPGSCRSGYLYNTFHIRVHNATSPAILFSDGQSHPGRRLQRWWGHLKARARLQGPCCKEARAGS